MSAVYRNARYEARLLALEKRQGDIELRVVQLCHNATFMLAAIEGLGYTLAAQSEALPGERPIDGPRAH